MRAPSPERWLAQIAEESFDVPVGLVERTMRRLESELAGRRRMKRSVFGRLTVAAILCLPVVLTVNVLEAYLLYSALARFLPATVASGLTAAVILSMLLTLAVAYGSLPLLASFGLRLREQTS